MKCPAFTIALLLVGLVLWLPAVAAPNPGRPLNDLRPTHPRLLVTAFSALQDDHGDELHRALREHILAAAEATLHEEPAKHKLTDGVRLLFVCRDAFRRITVCATAYRLSGDKRFRDRAVEEMLTVSKFPDWNPKHFLDVAEMSAAVGLGYDWLYDALSDDERRTIRHGLVENALKPGAAAYTGKGLWWATSEMNWNQVCNGGLLVGALAVADEEPDAVKPVVRGALKSLPRALKVYEPDGGYPEGPQYWSYGTTFHVLACAVLRSALGSDFKLSESHGFALTASYRLQVEGPAYLSFNYADGGPHLDYTPAYAWLAERFALATATSQARAQLERRLRDKASTQRVAQFTALDLIWFPSEKKVVGEPAALDAHFRGGADIATFRSAWQDPNGIYLGFKNGFNGASHSHLDLGSFVLDADGVRWSEDAGPDNYNLPGYFDAKTGGHRWKYFRLNNLGHSTLILNDELQDSQANALITAFSTRADRAFAIADLTAAYPKTAHKIERGAALLDRSRVLIQDEVTRTEQPVVMRWQMLTAAKIEISPDGKSATLSEKGKTLAAEIIDASAGSRFEIRATAAKEPGENQNRGYALLAIVSQIPAKSDARVIVLLSPQSEKWSKLPKPTVSPLSQWK